MIVLPPRYGLLQVGVIGVAFHFLARRLSSRLPAFLTANFITATGIIGSVCLAVLLALSSRAAGLLILLVMFSDFLDGAVARQRQSTSVFGGILDGIADSTFFLCVAIGLHFAGYQILALALLVVYAADLALRLLLGHSTSLLEKGGERYRLANASGESWQRLKPYIYPLVNYFDAVAILAIILLFFPSLVPVWMAYDFVRRVLVLTKKLREVRYVYIVAKRPG